MLSACSEKRAVQTCRRFNGVNDVTAPGVKETGFDRLCDIITELQIIKCFVDQWR